MGSYNIFNYGHRPAKSIERKLFVELLKEIYGVNPGKDYTYIGMGSIFFIDFKLLHKELGIENLINIEQNIEDQERFKFNRPFSCIKLKWGKSNDVLPVEDWKGKKILWLDYETSLREYMFEDLETTFNNANSGSFYFISLNSKLDRYTTNNGKHKLEDFKRDFEDYIPDGINKDHLTRNYSTKLIHRMINSTIMSILDQRNAALNENEKLEFHQLLFLKYQDGAPMMSIGGLLLSKSDYQNFFDKNFDKLSYVRTGTDPLDLISPVVTSQELDLMNNFLPRSQKNFLKLKKIAFIPEPERIKYQSTYRYYPNYVKIAD